MRRSEIQTRKRPLGPRAAAFAACVVLHHRPTTGKGNSSSLVFAAVVFVVFQQGKEKATTYVCGSLKGKLRRLRQLQSSEIAKVIVVAFCSSNNSNGTKCGNSEATTAQQQDHTWIASSSLTSSPSMAAATTSSISNERCINVSSSLSVVGIRRRLGRYFCSNNNKGKKCSNTSERTMIVALALLL